MITKNRYFESQKLLAYAKRYDAWAATYVKNYSSIEGKYPIYAQKAKGAYLWDIDGNRYIDFYLGYGTIILGHADARITAAVTKELAQGTCISPLWKPIQAELNSLLVNIIPGAEMSFLMKTGSDAVSGAVRLARAFTGKDKVVRWGYNGWHDWATPKPSGVPKNVQNDTLQFPFNDLNALKQIFLENKEKVACVVMMSFGLELPYPTFLQDVKELAHENGALFILDEMRSGFRFALGGAQEFFGVIADMSTFSKAMANGYSISAITGRADLLMEMEKTKMTATYFGSTIEMAAALQTIHILQQGDSIPYIWKLGEILKDGIEDLLQCYSIPAKYCGYPPCPFIKFYNETLKQQFFTETARMGVLFHPNHHWYISAAHKEEDIQFALSVCKKSFQILVDNY